MAHQIKDEKQEYQYSGGFTTPSGHEFQYYDTPENERFIMKHASGSHIEFKADGSIIVKSLKDLHVHSSIVSAANDGQQGASQGSDVTTNLIGTNYTLECLGDLKIKARSINIEAHDTMHMLAGTDMEMKATNTWMRAKEQIDIEGTASIRMDTDECTQAFRSCRTDIGTDRGEEGKKGGTWVISNHGTMIIEQTDETSNLTIRSKGYLNLVAGQERCDWIGKYTEMAHKEADKKATFWTKVFKPEKLDQNANSKQKPGDYVLETEAGANWYLGQKYKGSSENMEDGRHIDIKMGNDYLIIHEGDKDLIMLKGDYNEDLMDGDHDEIIMKGDKTLVMNQGDHEHTQTMGDKNMVVNGNVSEMVSGAKDQITGNGIKETTGNSHLEKICQGTAGGAGGSFFSDINLDDCALYQCPPNEIPPTVIPLPGISPNDDSAGGSNGGQPPDEGGGGGGGGGIPSLPIGTLMQILCGNFMNFSSMLNIQTAPKIFLN